MGWVPVLGIRGAASERSKLSIEFSWLQCHNRRNGDKTQVLFRLYE
jgi:hypothetical protein